jgi:hypothetical protein
MITYIGTVHGFKTFALAELHKAAMRGWAPATDENAIQAALQRAQTKDLCAAQTRRGPKEIA